MRHLLITLLFMITSIITNAQKQTYVSTAFFTTQNAMPFGKFAGLFKETIHPGIEFGYGKTIISKEKHDWFLELKTAYFFHRFVQHGIPLYLNYGYRYKLNKKFGADVAIGAGYMQSIPATAKLKLNNEGEYENNKGIGRMQATASVTFGINYQLNNSATKPISFFINYQQRLQMPFVKSYVPLLPYNAFFVGVLRSIKQKN